MVALLVLVGAGDGAAEFLASSFPHAESDKVVAIATTATVEARILRDKDTEILLIIGFSRTSGVLPVGFTSY
ncbi:hypothetical protein CEPID_08160 [Corynebacterium epidermidicanis]|uniref:Uncharacterized protein n=1 Tax=Corynebacterium epidermidicanis TaxID=1050174 RepID=A0A0G3GX80_9CORY|nr:hypothetical protein CEPID_08160 [Corynebacterium epidermidicanis]